MLAFHFKSSLSLYSIRCVGKQQQQRQQQEVMLDNDEGKLDGVTARYLSPTIVGE